MLGQCRIGLFGREVAWHCHTSLSFYCTPCGEHLARNAADGDTVQGSDTELEAGGDITPMVGVEGTPSELVSEAATSVVGEGEHVEPESPHSPTQIVGTGEADTLEQKLDVDDVAVRTGRCMCGGARSRRVCRAHQCTACARERPRNTTAWQCTSG